jgi:hypothetical protein
MAFDISETRVEISAIVWDDVEEFLGEYPELPAPDATGTDSFDKDLEFQIQVMDWEEAA